MNRKKKQYKIILQFLIINKCKILVATVFIVSARLVSNSRGRRNARPAALIMRAFSQATKNKLQTLSNERIKPIFVGTNGSIFDFGI